MTVTRADPGVQAGLRQAMANLTTGLCVVTTSSGGGRPHGTTMSGVMSLSMDPPMVLLSLARTSSLLARLSRGGTFGVNVLSAHQDQIALRFSKDVHDRFADIPWDDAGAPRLADAHAWVLADVSSLVPAGDHMLVLGDVVAAEAAGGRPLSYWQRTFGTHQAF
ncbi:flavin reductase family protein [Aeromicrobium camelliae]|nr:flavin reductase family protein [Aeromicrobium camelliae]